MFLVRLKIVDAYVELKLKLTDAATYAQPEIRSKRLHTGISLELSLTPT